MKACQTLAYPLKNEADVKMKNPFMLTKLETYTSYPLLAYATRSDPDHCVYIADLDRNSVQLKMSIKPHYFV